MSGGMEQNDDDDINAHLLTLAGMIIATITIYVRYLVTKDIKDFWNSVQQIYIAIVSGAIVGANVRKRRKQ